MAMISRTPGAAALALVALLILACGPHLSAPTDTPIGETVTATFHHDGLTITIAATRVDPDTTWLRMYAWTATCASLTASPDGITWFVMPHHVVFADGVEWSGVYDHVGRGIFLTDGDTMSIRHEALHDLLWIDRREAGHPSPPFGICEAEMDKSLTARALRQYIPLSSPVAPDGLVPLSRIGPFL